MAFLCFILLSNRKKKEGKVNEIQIIEAVTQPSTEMYLVLIPQSAMGCTHASIKHYLDMFLRAEVLRSISNYLRIIIPILHSGK